MFMVQLLLMLYAGNVIPFAFAQNPPQMCGFVDYALATPSFKESIVKTQKLCFNLCLSHRDCKSANYLLEKQHCEINNMSHLDSSVEVRPGSFYAFSASLSECNMTPNSTGNAISNHAGSSGMWIEQELSLIGKSSTQSSLYDLELVAGRANDGDASTSMGKSPYCSHTLAELHPWWHVDLGGQHWLGNITVVNRGDCCGNRLAGATVRAGLSPRIADNMMCGSPVSPTQAQNGVWIEFVCDPWILAQYVSVDINNGTRISLNICEVIVREYVRMKKDCEG